MTESYISSGTVLRYTVAGVGLPVVFLHPTPLDHDFWRPLVIELSGVRAIVPDLRGHGSSEMGAAVKIGGFARVPDAPVLTMNQLSVDLLELLDLLRIDTAVFVGCSIGGYMLFELWRQAPQRVRGMAFVCSKPQPDTEAALSKRVENIARVRADGVEGFFDTMAQTLIGATARSQRPPLVAEVRTRMTMRPENVVAVQAGLATRPDSVSTVPTIEVPVLAIAGGEDPAVSVEDMKAFRQARRCESHVIPDAGHFAAFEQPQRVASILGNWLEQFRI
ncbi:alpha/beta hydrolase [Acidobacteria bacterium AB60]|nr:alpha/beta hydrolase [Acidobacteria bacterium AB60]